MLKAPWPPGGGGPSPSHRTGLPAVRVGVVDPSNVANVPVAVVFPRMPGALLRVKLRSLTAWPALMIVLAASVLVIVTVREPALVTKSAVALSGPSLPIPVAEKDIG